MNPQPFEARLAQVEGGFVQIVNRLTGIEQRFDGIDQRFASVDLRFNALDQRITWLIGIVVGTWITTIFTILFHH